MGKSLSRREVLWRFVLAGAGFAAGAALAGAAGLRLARQLYLERADLRLDPAGLARFAAANRDLPAGGRPRLVFFGDSRVEQWPTATGIAQRELVFRGISGQTTAQLRFRFDDDVLALAPSEIVIQAGINDLIAGLIAQRRGEAREQTVRNLAALAESAGARGVSVLLTTIVRPAAPGLSQRLLFSSEDLAADVAAVNAQLREMSSTLLTVIDIDARLAGATPTLPPAYATDAVHLSPAAYAIINDEIKRAIEDSPRAGP